MALPIVQLIKNNKFHEGINMTPYKALFDYEMNSGLQIFNLPVQEKSKIKTAKQLYTLLGN